MSETVLLHIENRVATLTLNRPGAMNALNLEMARALAHACQKVEQDKNVRCIVLRGAGGNFLAGGDVQSMKEGLDKGDSSIVDGIITHVHRVIEALRHAPAPVIGVVEGAVAGGGVSLIAACDLAIATDKAKFTLAYSRLGTNPDGGSTWFLPRIIGLRKTMELCLFSDRFDAKAALAMGLVNEVVPAAKLDAAVDRMVARVMAGSGEAAARTKQLLNESMQNSLTEQLAAEQNAFMAGVRSNDFAEGVNAFCDKRKPKFD